MKNSSRLDVKMARNLRRSSNGVRSSKACASTRRLNSSQARSRSNHSFAKFSVDMFMFLFLREHALPVNPCTHNCCGIRSPTAQQTPITKARYFQHRNLSFTLSSSYGNEQLKVHPLVINL